MADFLRHNAADYAEQHISVRLDKAFRIYRTGSKAGALGGTQQHNTHVLPFVVTVLVFSYELPNVVRFLFPIGLFSPTHPNPSRTAAIVRCRTHTLHIRKPGDYYASQ